MTTTTATLLPFPPRVHFSALHWFSLEHGRAGVVAVLFRVHGNDMQHPASRGHDSHAEQQAGQAVVEGQP